MLAAYDQEAHTLRPEVRELLSGRAYNPRHRRDAKPLLPYDESIWKSLQEVYRAEIQEAWSQFRGARAAAEKGRDPYQHGWSYENLCWWMVRHGPDTTPRYEGKAVGRLTEGIACSAQMIFPVAV
ncbi:MULTISPECIES: hypothetical protein [Streptomyces]|uniref:hypothetical protein n=1 Tax=Streptomyces TaxID=1883 RepID=UPI0022593413|nr:MULTISPECIES: hypothetical protein [Streptomyces]MCX5276783.1 hypothetical protein [Streptomyces virginiae]